MRCSAKSTPIIPHYTSIFASLVSKSGGTIRKYLCDKARGCFFSFKWWKHVILRVINTLVHWKSSLHHQARPLTHSLLQWHCAAADTANFIIFVCPCLCLSHCPCHPSHGFFWMCSYSVKCQIKWLKMDFNYACPANRGSKILVF